MGKLRQIIKNVGFAVLGQPALLKRRIEKSARENRLTILNFHRVSPDDGSSYPPLDPEMFDEALSFCKRHFTITNFCDLQSHDAHNGPLAIISFDDGYADFLHHALPALRRHGIRANQNFIPQVLKSGLPPANVLLQDFIGKAPASDLAPIDELGLASVPCASDRFLAGFEVSDKIKAKPIAEQEAIIAELSKTIDLRRYATSMVTADDVRAVRDEVEIGAHSFEHATLSAETDDYIRADARRCRAYFEQDLGIPTDIYALPNGGGADRAPPLIREAGFKHILLTDERYSRPGSEVHPRFTMDGVTRGEVRFRSTGFERH